MKYQIRPARISAFFQCFNLVPFRKTLLDSQPYHTEQAEYLQIMAEKYTLNWNEFTEHLQVMFKDLYQEGRYTDVTLVSDDQIQFKAHKIVLSACTLVFKNIIDSNLSQHPLIYLRGIQSYEVDSILQYMYLGEGRI